MKNTTTTKFLNLFILIFIAISISVMIYLKLKSIVYTHDDNIKTFYSFKKSFKFYKEIMQKPWKPRLFSAIFASFFMPKDQIIDYYNIKTEDEEYLTKIEIKDYQLFYHRVGLYTIFWLFLINFLFIFFKKNKAIFYMTALFLSLSYVYIPDTFARVYPWDMPALFFYTFALFLLLTNNYIYLFFIIPIATGFKETAILLSFLFLLLNEKSFKEKILYTFIALFASILIKFFLGIITENSALFFSMESSLDSFYNAIKNIASIFNGELYSILFINGGLTVAFLLIPTKDKIVNGLKIISLLFIIFNFIYGNIKEYRIFIELIPFSVYAFDKIFINQIGVIGDKS